jgi:hypothetical protein
MRKVWVASWEYCLELHDHVSYPATNAIVSIGLPWPRVDAVVQRSNKSQSSII